MQTRNETDVVLKLVSTHGDDVVALSNEVTC
ncbi:unannotated protein [freshwater metagenome]|uniref:Unannotated protein n=1 Tax=freshwater metagenome TaxID=449393 RepID=A0A6J6PSN2_9ZZZZ